MSEDSNFDAEDKVVIVLHMTREEDEDSTRCTLDDALWCYINSYLDLSDIFSMRCVTPTWNIATIAYPSRRTPIIERLHFDPAEELGGRQNSNVVIDESPVWQENLLGVRPVYDKDAYQNIT